VLLAEEDSNHRGLGWSIFRNLRHFGRSQLLSPSPHTRSMAAPSLYARLVAAMVVMCISVIAISAAMIWHSRVESINSATSVAGRLAVSLAQQATDALTINETVVGVYVERIEQKGTSPRQLDRLHLLAVSDVASIPSLHGLFIIDRRGRPIVTALKVTPQGLNYSDREYFRFHASHETRAFHVGPAVRSKSDGSWVFTISQRLNDAHGNFAGIAECTISVAYFKRLYGAVQLGPNGLIDLIRDDGIMLVRTPFDAKYLGVSVAKSDLFQTYLPRAPAGSFSERSFLDHVGRLHAYRHLDRFPIVMLVAVPEDDALANWRADAMTTLVVVIVLVLMISGLGVYLGIEVRKGQRMEYELAKLAFVDGLTGVANRRCFDDGLEREWRRAARDRSMLSVLMIDVDRFKLFNDTYGHQRGDEVLQTVAGCVTQTVHRPGDLAARYGGEEFVVLLPATSAAGALVIAESIRHAVEKHAIPSSGSPTQNVTVSVGVASVMVDLDASPAQLLQAADAALYQAKHAGRNQVVLSQTLFANERHEQ